MSYQRVRSILEQTAKYCTEQGIPFRQQQLFGCLATYDRLVATAGGHKQALTIFNRLMAEIMSRKDPWYWLETELRFETYAAAIGNRNLAAMADLERRAEVGDDALDTYNERLNRFATR